jgi:nitroreductase
MVSRHSPLPPSLFKGSGKKFWIKRLFDESINARYYKKSDHDNQKEETKMEAVLQRRSIRKYTDQKVPEDSLTALLKAAMAAPSAGNEQPWHFVVIKERLILDQVPTVHPHAQMIKQAPVAVLVCGDTDLAKHGEMWIQDCSAATENLLIAAQAEGLGAVWLGVYPREDRIRGLRELLGIPDHVFPFALIPIGFPGEQKPPSNRYNEERIHYDRW